MLMLPQIISVVINLLRELHSEVKVGTRYGLLCVASIRQASFHPALQCLPCHASQPAPEETTCRNCKTPRARPTPEPKPPHGRARPTDDTDCTTDCIDALAIPSHLPTSNGVMIVATARDPSTPNCQKIDPRSFSCLCSLPHATPL